MAVLVAAAQTSASTTRSWHTGKTWEKDRVHARDRHTLSISFNTCNNTELQEFIILFKMRSNGGSERLNSLPKDTGRRRSRH